MSLIRADRIRRDARALAGRPLDHLEQVRDALAHDFNHMVAVIVAVSEALAGDPARDPQDRRLAGLALRAAERGAQMLRRMMALGPGRRIDVERVDAAEALRDVADFARLLTPATVAASVHTPKRPLAVIADRAALESAVLNLCVNAGQAMAGGGELSLDIRKASVGEARARRLCLESGSYVVFRVRDTGPGMTPEVLARATQARFTTRATRGGSGLGLSSVDAFAKSAGGALTLASREGHGVTAEIYLPAV